MFEPILKVIAARLEREAEVAKIETTVLCMDLQATTNRRLGQIKRRALERMRYAAS